MRIDDENIFDDLDEQDKEILMDIKRKSEDIEIPESIKPDNIMKMIEKKESKIKKHKIIKQIVGWGAVAAVIIISFMIGKSGMKDTIKTKDNKQSDQYTYAYISEKLNSLIGEGGETVWEDNEYNMYEMADGAVNDAEARYGMTEEADIGKGSAEDDSYSTNIQVQDVDEADVVKNDGRYIYIFNRKGGRIDIIDTDNDTKISSTCSIESYLEYMNTEMYICDDRLVIVGSYVTNETNISIYDISDKGNIKEINTIRQQGNYYTSRMKDGYVYILTDIMLEGKVTEDDCVPMLNGKQISPKRVSITDDISSPGYIFAVSVDLNNPEKAADEYAVTLDIGYEFCEYVSENAIYLCSNVRMDGENILYKINYKNGKFSDAISGNVQGYVYGQFAMDEYNGYLRMVTTYEKTSEGNSKNILTIFDENLNQVGMIDDIAKNETIKSARFEGNTGYFVTYRETDPLFKVNLTDPENPQIEGELKIPGYSGYLHLWGDNNVIGIGYDHNKLKISMFETGTADDMKELATRKFEDYSYSPGTYNHKALMIDYDKNIIGFVCVYDNSITYEIFSYTDYEFVSRMSVDISGENSYFTDDLNYGGGSCSDIRGMYIGDTVYIVIPGDKVVMADIDSMQTKGEISLS